MFRETLAQGSRSSASVPQVQRRTITEEVLGRLRELLLQGVLKPGTRIDQAELAASFGVSTVPVREALLRLQSAGLVEVIPHRGVFVSEVSVEELLDIYTTRELLEEQAARLAAVNLNESVVETLEDLAAGMQAAASRKQLDELLALNREFHFTIYRAAKRRHLLQLIEQLWDLSTRYAHLQLHAVPDRASEALYEIRSIVSACERKDADALGWMIRYKVHQTTAGLLQHMSLPDTAPELGAKRAVSPPKAPRKAPAPLAKKKPSPKSGKKTMTKKAAAKKAPGRKASRSAATAAKGRRTKGGRGT